MRLRNIPGAKETIENSRFVVHQVQEKRGDWKKVFGNENPVHIEVGMGKGRFLMEMAALNPEINYVGIEMYDSVLLRAVQKMEEKAAEGTAPDNLRFIRMDARELPLVFGKNEVGRIYLNFSDPWPKARHARRRLTSVDYLKRYASVLSEHGQIEFKTDNEALFDFSLESAEEAGWTLLGCTRNLHQDPVMNEGNIMTEYEEKFSAKGNPIFKMIAVPPRESSEESR